MIYSLLSYWFALITIPTHITLLRIFLVPCIVSCIVAHAWAEAILLFSFAALTDVLDGALARFLQKITLFGSLLDSFADKLLLISSYAALAVSLQFSTIFIPWWFLGLVIGNEIILTGLSFYWGIIQKSITLKPTQLGRMTSLGQILFISWLFMCSGVAVELTGLFYCLFTLVIMARVCTNIDYAIIAYSKE